MAFHTFFSQATDGKKPYPYQSRLASMPWPDLLDVPTGLGKTAAVTLAWLFKRGWRSDEPKAEPDTETPRRLVWCLPMRVLVEQTEESIRQWLQRLGVLGNVGERKVSVHVLMGGADDLKSWVEYPEEEMILVGTQDMLLSRALMRGYGMSRYQWPVHFSLLHNDCLWVYDEVQLMGAGLATSTQLDAFRRRFPLAQNSRSLWLSATLNPDWLATVDMKPHLDSLSSLTINEADRQQAGDRLNAVKHLAPAQPSLTNEAGKKEGKAAYLECLRDTVLKAHATGTQTLVIVNRVERAQALYRLLREQRPEHRDLLIHARFRAKERREQTQQLRNNDTIDRIVVATQAIEAGVDISSRTLITELAPWSSLVQRFGRCNRYGEHNPNGGAQILWIGIDEDADTLPYKPEELTEARERLADLSSASPDELPATCEQRPLTAVLRRKDLLDLFNTDPDLSGFDVDVSDYIRDSDNPGLQVFWRDFQDEPNKPEPQSKPDRDELCPVSLSQAKAFHKRKDVLIWRWDTLDNQWVKLSEKMDPRPGMTLLLRAADGGYDDAVGFDAGIKKPHVETYPPQQPERQEGYSGDGLSVTNRPIALPDHLANVATYARRLCDAVDEAAYDAVVVRAGRWHDLGKAHSVFQASMYRCKDTAGEPLAKSDCPGHMIHNRPYFRHELASMLAWLDQHEGEPDANLIAYLIAAHHGKVRMSLRAMPDEYDKYQDQNEKPDGKRFARGIWEGDKLPELDFDGEYSAEATLQLALMEIGYGEQGPSWTERTLKLLDEHGPFQLAWLETLVRIADWRASAAEQDAS